VLIAEIGDITRFASTAKLARYTGCAPFPVYSSDQERTDCTAEAIAASTASSTPPPSCRNDGTRPPNNCRLVTSRPRAAAVHVASFNDTWSTCPSGDARRPGGMDVGGARKLNSFGGEK
jgi:hypothetical protein